MTALHGRGTNNSRSRLAFILSDSDACSSISPFGKRIVIWLLVTSAILDLAPFFCSHLAGRPRRRCSFHPYARPYRAALRKTLAPNNLYSCRRFLSPISIHSVSSPRDSADNPLSVVKTEHSLAKYTPLPRSHSIPLTAPDYGTPLLRRIRSPRWSSSYSAEERPPPPSFVVLTLPVDSSTGLGCIGAGPMSFQKR
ncbi:hypothetical protein R3P38DRAFT_3179365 [Favolaschia claudopus]|uniref:Uncharacterized protein n=1 Tax=Favolaschia claudopus TaxID=2862362 RepID=A0AAW0CYD2_9AGAR